MKNFHDCTHFVYLFIYQSIRPSSYLYNKQIKTIPFLQIQTIARDLDGERVKEDEEEVFPSPASVSSCLKFRNVRQN